MGLLEKARQAQHDAKDQQAAKEQARAALLAPTTPSGMTYRVVAVRSTIVGDRMDADNLQDLLNQMSSEGWTLRQLVESDVKGRVGPGGTSGLLAIFERPA
jgi:hypothetical protein